MRVSHARLADLVCTYVTPRSALVSREPPVKMKRLEDLGVKKKKTVERKKRQVRTFLLLLYCFHFVVVVFRECMYVCICKCRRLHTIPFTSFSLAPLFFFFFPPSMGFFFTSSLTTTTFIP